MSIWQTKSWQKMLKKSGQVSDYFEIPYNLPFSKGVPEGGGIIFVEKRSI